MITNEEIKKIFKFKILTYKELALLIYLDLNNFKDLDLKLIAYETNSFVNNLTIQLKNLKNKGFLKENSNGVHTTFTPFQFED